MEPLFSSITHVQRIVIVTASVTLDIICTVWKSREKNSPTKLAYLYENCIFHSNYAKISICFFFSLIDMNSEKGESSLKWSTKNIRDGTKMTNDSHIKGEKHKEKNAVTNKDRWTEPTAFFYLRFIRCPSITKHSQAVLNKRNCTWQKISCFFVWHFCNTTITRWRYPSAQCTENQWMISTARRACNVHFKFYIKKQIKFTCQYNKCNQKWHTIAG